MRPELLLIEKIEQYLEGKLNPEEKVLFEKQLSENTGLQEEVELQRQIMGSIQRSLVKKEIAAAFTKYKTIVLLWKLAIISSGIIITAVSTVLLYNHLNNAAEIKTLPNIEKPQIKTESESQDTSLSFNTDSTISVRFSNISEINTNNSNITNTPAVKQERTTSIIIEELPSADTAIKNEAPALKPIITSSETKKNSSSVKKLSELEKKERISKFFIDLKAPVTWLGLDFSNVRVLEDESDSENEQTEKISKKHFNEWNDLVFAEQKRYDIAGALRHNTVNYSTEYVYSKNDTIQVDRIFVKDKSALNHLNSSSIQNIVNAYSLENKKGYGVVFIVESLDKSKKETNTWVTLIDMKTGQMLITEKMYANAHGQGLRNFWARGFHNTINDIKERKYEEWKLKYKK